MAAYYNEFDKNAAEWLRELIKQGSIAEGEVDDRSITEVRADDLRGFNQCHFFAGIGIWSYALRRVGIADTDNVWTGSCPCQPFSTAGKQEGLNDSRHLWPVFYELIRECRPQLVFGEQVTGKKIYGTLFDEKKFNGFDEKTVRRVAEENSDAWLYHVQSDLEGADYSMGHAHFPACGIGAPHQRQRCYWVGVNTVGDSRRTGLEGYDRNVEGINQPGRNDQESNRPARTTSRISTLAAGTVGNPESQGQRREYEQGHQGQNREYGSSSGLADAGLSEPSGWHCTASDREGYGRCECEGCKPASYGSEDGVENSIVKRTRNNSGQACEQGRHSVDRRPESIRQGDRQIVSDGDNPTDTVSDVAHSESERELRKARNASQLPRPTNGIWGDPDWLFCRDGKWRPVESFSGEMADGLADRLGYRRVQGVWKLSPLKEKAEARVMRLKAYGNAIVGEQAALFIESVMETINNA